MKLISTAILVLFASLVSVHSVPARADAHADLGLAWQAFVRSDYDRAIALYSRAIDSGKLSGRHLPDAHHNRGRSYHALGQYDKSIADYGRIIELNPYFAQVYVSRGHAYRAQGRLDLAIKDYGQVVELAPQKPDGYLFRAEAYIEQGNHDEALADQSKLVEMAPEDSFARAARCATLEIMSRIKEAVVECRRALAIDPGNVGATETLKRIGASE